jgi:type II secretory pathway pseudopilin PulG
MNKMMKDEKGIAMVVALVILLVLTLIGFSSISTSTFESSISGNERTGTDAFYAAEAGLQRGFNQLPVTTAIPVTALGDTSYWSGSVKDKTSPKPLTAGGLFQKSGYDVAFSFRIYGINASGDSFGAMKEVDSKVCYGPFSSGTSYNN